MSIMKLTLGFSPCPNDTFIFDAMIHGKIDTEGLEFECVIEDVETLNRKAFKGELDVTKLSYHAFAYLVDQYVLLDAGSALGFGVGPLLIAREAFPEAAVLPDLRVGIPGKLTTANFLLSLAYPGLTDKREMLFSEIEDALLNGEIDLGLIIHENRFTYAAKGLHKVVDLGDFWEQETGAAIPLGGIVVNRRHGPDTQLKLNRVLRKSVEFAFADPKSSLDFVRRHSQEMSEEVMYKHIELYVNKYSVDLGPEGRKAVHTLFERARRIEIIPSSENGLFINSAD